MEGHDSASEGSTFSISSHDVFYVSLSLNACFLLQLLFSRGVEWALPWYSKQSSRGQALLRIHKQWPGLLGRILMEQISLFSLLVLILVNLSVVSSSILPFRRHTSADYHPLTRVILCAATARFLILALGLLLVSDVTACGADGEQQSKLNIQGSETGSARWHFTYCVICIVSNVIGIGYKQNLFLLSTSSFMELNSTSLVICRLIRLADRHRGCQSYFKTSILCCAMCLFSRVLLPLLFICLALSQESPFIMDTVPLIWFFISATLYFLFHAGLVYNSFKRIPKAFAFSSEVAAHTCQQNYLSNEPFSIYNYPDRLTNDIFDDTLLENEKDGLADEGCESNIAAKLRVLNYGYLPCYDNRNLCSFVSKSEEEKINFLQKKNSSKHEFLNKFSADGKLEFNNCYTGRHNRSLSRLAEHGVSGNESKYSQENNINRESFPCIYQNIPSDEDKNETTQPPTCGDHEDVSSKDEFSDAITGRVDRDKDGTNFLLGNPGLFNDLESSHPGEPSSGEQCDYVSGCGSCTVTCNDDTASSCNCKDINDQLLTSGCRFEDSTDKLLKEIQRNSFITCCDTTSFPRCPYRPDDGEAEGRVDMLTNCDSVMTINENSD